MASAQTKIGNGQLPSGFVSPFTRVPCSTHDDLISIVSCLSGRTHEEVIKLAVTLGMRRFNFWIDDAMVRKLLLNLSPLGISPYKDFTTFSAMPDVAILLVDWDATTETGRHVLFHHVRGTGTQQAFSYVIDPSELVDDSQKITTSFSHLNVKPAWFMEVTPRPNPNGTKPK